MLFLTLTTAALLAVAPSSPVCAPSGPTLFAQTVPTDANPHLQYARAALAQGDLITARREFRFAQIVDRETGVLPVEATNALASLLYADSSSHEAAEVLQQLVDEAFRTGDLDVEAHALVSVTWLRIEAGQRFAAKAGVRRLHEIARDRRISPATRERLRQSLG